MANETSAQSASTSVATLPNPRRGMRDRMNQVRQTMSGMIDLSIFENKLGTAVDPGLLKKLIADGQYTLECVLAEQHRVVGAGVDKPTIADLVGSPAQRTQLRELITAFVAEAVDSNVAEVNLKCLLRPAHPTLPNVAAVLNGGAAHLAKELGWKVKLPRFSIEGKGLDQGQVGGHVPAIIAKAKAMAEEDVKRIAAS